jgi:hypothetical protein
MRDERETVRQPDRQSERAGESQRDRDRETRELRER